MDESFDELKVPDNWHARKRKLDESADSNLSSTKHSELNVSSPKKCSLLESSSTTKISSDSEISSENETLEDTSINEPDLFSDNSFPEFEGRNKSEINGHVLVTNKQNGNDKGEPFQLKYVEDKAFKVHEETISNLDSENRFVTEYSVAVPALFDRTEICTNETHSGAYNEYHSNFDIKKTLTGCNTMVKCVDPNCSMFERDTDLTAPQSSEQPGFSNGKSGLKSIMSVTRDAKLIAEIVPNKDINMIYKMLLEHRDNGNRLDVVTFQLTQTEDNISEGLTSSVDIFEEVRQVALAIPSISVNEIYTMLEQLPPSSNRVDSIISKLMVAGIPVNDNKCSLYSGTPAPEMNTSIALNGPFLENDPLLQDTSLYSGTPATEMNNSVTLNDSFLENDPLLQDMKTIAKMFPEKDRNEIYALLEANFKAANRLEKVINEILHVDNADVYGSQQSQSLGTRDTVERTINSNVTEDIIGQDMERIRNIFPDCDPNYLYEELDSMKDVPDRTDVLATKMFENKNYPKLKDLLEKEKEKEKEKTSKTKHLTMTVEEFLQKFPDPVKTFVDSAKEPSDVYKKHSEVLLQNEFPMFKSDYLTKILRKCNGHLYLAYQKVSALLLKTPLAERKNESMFMKRSRSKKLPMPDDVDEYFYHELWFVYNELSVSDYIKQKEKERKMKIETAKVTGELHECCCCYDDECLLEDLASCPEGHLFCKTCVVRSTEAAFGEMKTKFPCLTGECDQDIPISYLQTIIPANLFSKIVRRLQEEEVQQANIPDLVTCPFCPFAAIMSNPLDKVFKCLNPECLKESCRLCQEPNHIPLRCNEVEKKAETDMRVYIENQISEAVMRKCHRCGKRFVKDDGCNKMTCVCGATSCYACKATDIDYDHFNNNTKCSNVDSNTIHQHDMENAAVKAKSQYLLDHPEATDVELKTDVKDMINTFKNSEKARHKRHLQYESDEDFDDEMEEDYEDESDESYEYAVYF